MESDFCNNASFHPQRGNRGALMSSMTFFRTCSNFYKPQPLRSLEL